MNTKPFPKVNRFKRAFCFFSSLWSSQENGPDDIQWLLEELGKNGEMWLWCNDRERLFGFLEAVTKEFSSQGISRLIILLSSSLICDEDVKLVITNLKVPPNLEVKSFWLSEFASQTFLISGDDTLIFAPQGNTAGAFFGDWFINQACRRRIVSAMRGAKEIT